VLSQFLHFEQEPFRTGQERVASSKLSVAQEPQNLRKTSNSKAAHTKVPETYEQPVVEPQVSHFRQVPFRTSVKFAHSGQDSPT